ncbi:hypothetical protein [Dactylosporangium sp. NPDC048998]|uniref:hypothetical protein n=1 Tax=Dactylosporangium sp. NPDC048998 TaxID=3363976 RepID=UPI003718E81F
MLAYLIAVEVAVQATAVVYAMYGLGKWVDGGGVLDKAVMESGETSFPGAVGFAVHGMNGMMIVPLVALLMLIFSFFTKVRGAAKWAGLVLLLVVVQVSLGMFGHDVPALGALHGLNALLLFGAAVYAGHRARAVPSGAERPEAPVATPV